MNWRSHQPTQARAQPAHTDAHLQTHDTYRALIIHPHGYILHWGGALKKIVSMLRICCTKQLGVIKALHIKGNPIEPAILFGKKHSTSHSEWKLPIIQPQSWAAEQTQSTQLSDKVMRKKMVQHEQSAATLTLTVWMVKIDPAAWRFWFTEFVTESQTNTLRTLRWFMKLSWFSSSCRDIANLLSESSESKGLPLLVTSGFARLFAKAKYILWSSKHLPASTKQ